MDPDQRSVRRIHQHLPLQQQTTTTTPFTISSQEKKRRLDVKKKLERLKFLSDIGGVTSEEAEERRKKIVQNFIMGDLDED